MAYPIVVNLAGRKCVVIGGGVVAQRRAESLIAGGGAVVVVAPTFTRRITELAAAGKLTRVEDRYAAEHTDGAFVVIAATNDRDVNRAVCDDAHARGLLVSCVDRPDEGSFATPATIERGELLIAVTTGGANPTLTAVLREELAELYGDEWALWTEMFSRLRTKFQTMNGQEHRRAAAKAILRDTAVAARIADADVAGAAEEAQKCISSLPD